MDASEQDPILSTINGIYCWEGRKPGLTLFHAYAGQLRLTTRRVLFLSTGSHGIVRAAIFNLIGGLPAQLTLGRVPTEHLDMRAMANPGSLDVPLQRIHRSWVARRLLDSYLVLEMLSAPEFGVSFMTRYGRDRRELLAFCALLERTRRSP